MRALLVAIGSAYYLAFLRAEGALTRGDYYHLERQRGINHSNPLRHGFCIGSERNRYSHRDESASHTTTVGDRSLPAERRMFENLTWQRAHQRTVSFRMQRADDVTRMKSSDASEYVPFDLAAGRHRRDYRAYVSRGTLHPRQRVRAGNWGSSSYNIRPRLPFVSWKWQLGIRDAPSLRENARPRSPCRSGCGVMDCLSSATVSR